MGLCFGRRALAGVGNFCVSQAKTWHRRSGNWLHSRNTVSVLLFSVFCLSVFLFQIQHDFVSASHQGLLKRFLGVSSRQISLLLTLIVPVTGSTQWQQNQFNSGTERKKKEVMNPSWYKGMTILFLFVFIFHFWVTQLYGSALLKRTEYDYHYAYLSFVMPSKRHPILFNMMYYDVTFVSC